MMVEVIQTADGIFYDSGADKLVPVPCQWFALCTNHAGTTREHPSLGSVPICHRCNDKVARMTDERGLGDRTEVTK